VALDCRHGRVLLDLLDGSAGFLVWDPVTGDRHAVPEPDILYYKYTSSAAVLCAAPGCDHLDYHGGPFRVALLCTDEWDITRASVYSSEMGAWSEPVSLLTGSHVQTTRIALVGDEIYFVVANCGADAIGVHGGARNCLSVVNQPPQVAYNGLCALMVMEDGSLGISCIEGSSLHLWSRKVGSEGAAEWVKCRVIELVTMTPMADPGDGGTAYVIGLAEGVDVIFVSTDDGVCVHIGAQVWMCEEGRRAWGLLLRLALHELLHPWYGTTTCFSLVLHLTASICLLS
jgi:hypothetical protein